MSETPKPLFTISNVWRPFSLRRWPCLEGTVTQSRMNHLGEEERAFSSPQSFSQCLKLMSIRDSPHLFKTSTSTIGRVLSMHKLKSNHKKFAKSSLSDSVLLVYPAPFRVCFWKFSGVGQSHQLWWYIKPGWHMNSTTAFIILPYALTFACC